MHEIFSKIWTFSEQRHGTLKKALGFSFLRSVFGVCQLLAVITAIEVLTGITAPGSGILRIVLLALICIAGNFITSYNEQANTLETGFFMVADKRVSAANLLRRLPLGFFNNRSTGRITATLTTTLSGVESAAAMVMIGIISGLLSSFVLFVFMLVYDWRIGLLAGLGMVCYLMIVNWQMAVSRKNAPALQEAQTKLAEATLSFLQGIKVTKAFSFKSGDRRMKEAIDGSCAENINLTGVSMPSQFAAGLCIAVFESAILITSLYLSLVLKDIDLVKTVVLMIFSFMVYASLNQAGSMLSMIGLLDAGIEEISEIERNKALESVQPLQHAGSDRITFQNVSFSYGDNQVLHNISTVIEPHSLTAVIGPSGSGKTTLCQLIPRFRDVSAGTITIGGSDVRHIPQEELMKKISMVFQNVYLFEDTILNNIRFGRPEASLEEVRAAARAARCDDFIMALPQGYDTVVQEGGSSLSGGEKQRISIARAILKDSSIVILDEATSALDAENEHEILAAIDQLTRNKTVIMIAHRIQTVEKADHIIALKDGRIVQEGKHAELASVPGLYADFLSSRAEAAQWTLST